MENELKVLQSVASIFQELLAPVVTLTSACELLESQILEELSGLLKIVADLSSGLRDEIQQVNSNKRSAFDLRSKPKTALQLRQYAIQWQADNLALEDAIKKLYGLTKQMGIVFADEDTNFLLEILIRQVQILSNLLARLQFIEDVDIKPTSFEIVIDAY